MPDTRLDFNPLEVRGLFLVQRNYLDAAARAAEAAKLLAGLENEAAALLAGRVPEGVTIRSIRIDQATGAVYATEPAPVAPSAP